jgi:Ribbon-helix-helix protein, copG family
MRTTLTIDPDVAAALQRLRKSRDASLKEVVNEALRRGLKELTARKAPPSRIRTRSVSLGRPKIESLDNIGEVIADAEGEAYR